jgi:MFS family permease
VNRNDRAITALVMVGHSMVHTYEMSIPIFVVIWLLEFDVTTATLGAVVTVGYALFGVGALPGGVLADRYSSRTLIIAGLAGMGLSFLALSFAGGLLGIAVALAVWGVAASVYHPAGLSLISKGVSERGTGLAYHGIAGNLGIGLGPLLAAILLLFVEWRTVALVLGAPAVLAAAYAARADFDETAAVTEGGAATDGGSKAESGVDDLGEFLTESKRLFAGGFVLVFVVVMCSGLYYRGVLTFLPEVLRDLTGFDPIPVGTLLPAPLRAALGVEAGGGQPLRPQDYFYSGLLLVGVAGQYAGGSRDPDPGRRRTGDPRECTAAALVGYLSRLVAESGRFVGAAGSLVREPLCLVRQASSEPREDPDGLVASSPSTGRSTCQDAAEQVP